MTVHRSRPLPAMEAVGRLVVCEAVLSPTLETLMDAGRRQPPHEGLVWWLGRRVGDDVYVLSSVSPAVRSGPQGVFASEGSTGAAAAAARSHHLGVVAQVHSHPGVDTRHSDGDDHLILMPFDGMFSLVVANYGTGGLLPANGAGLHQYQHGTWTWVSDAASALIVVPGAVNP